MTTVSTGPIFQKNQKIPQRSNYLLRGSFISPVKPSVHGSLVTFRCQDDDFGFHFKWRKQSTSARTESLHTMLCLISGQLQAFSVCV
jgi:hypothetical protein